MIKVSIVVPIYKIKEEYLRTCIESLIKQTLEEIEIILIDDGSPDSCGAICDEYKVRDERIMVIHQDNQGVSVARNSGIEVSKGEYIIFVDSDDWVSVDMCEKVYHKIVEDNSDILIFGYASKYFDFEEIHLLGNNTKFSEEEVEELQQIILNPRGRYLEISPASPWCKVFRKNFILENNLRYVPGLKRMQDNVFCINAYALTRNVSYYNYLGYCWRANATSICIRYNPEIIETSEKVLKEFRDYLHFHSKNQNYIEAYYCKVITILTGEYMRSYFRHHNCPIERKKLKREFSELIKKELYEDAIRNVKMRLLTKRYKIILMFLKLHLVSLLWIAFDTEDKLRVLLKKNHRVYQ